MRRNLSCTSTGARFQRCILQPIGQRTDRSLKRRIIMAFSLRVLISTAALGFCVVASTTMAQETSMPPAAASSSMGAMNNGMMKGNMMQGNMMQGKMHHKGNGSMHRMPATVTSIDKATGIVEVTAGGMSLRVHFPPPSVANLKAGDKITLHMGFSK
ncbi:MAG: hypothetical protein ABI178_07465 [Rhodanobacter sp.]